MRSKAMIPCVVAALLGCAGKAPPRLPGNEPLATEATFDLAAADAHTLFIWDWARVPADAFEPAVILGLERLGFRRGTPIHADFLVNLQVFTNTRGAPALILVLEVLDPVNQGRLWVGQADLAPGRQDAALAEMLSEFSRDPIFRRMLASRRRGGNLAPSRSAPPARPL